MSWYATEQLARQRHDQFVSEARGHRRGRDTHHATSKDQRVVDPGSFHRIPRLIHRLVGAMSVSAMLAKRPPRHTTKPSIDHRVIGARDA